MFKRVLSAFFPNNCRIIPNVWVGSDISGIGQSCQIVGSRVSDWSKFLDLIKIFVISFFWPFRTN